MDVAALRFFGGRHARAQPATVTVTADQAADAGGIAATLPGLSHGRAAEANADAFVIAALRRARLRADGLGRFFAQIAAHSGSGPSFLSDHPGTADREARVRQLATGAAAFDPAEWQAIRTMCQP